MAEKKFKGSPFGVQSARFDVSGVHPKNKTPGTFTQTPYCKIATSTLNTQLGPGKYAVEGLSDFSSQSVAERASGPGWARQVEVAQIASMPHQLHKEQWDLNRLLKRKLGPGTYDIKDFLQSSDEKPRSTRGIIQTKEPRFREKLKNEHPGPGTYGHGGVPHAASEEKSKQSPGTIGMLDAGASGARGLPVVGSRLGPGSYQFNSFTDLAKKQVTSIRGPYDLFSLDRNKPIKTGHYAAPMHAALGPGQYEIKSFVEEMGSQHKKKQGRFGKVDQYPPKPTERIYGFTLPQNPRVPEEPGPGTHNPIPHSDKAPSQAKLSPPFLSSAPRVDRMATKFFTGNFNPVGAGRYDVQKWEEAQDTNGHVSVFKSKTVKPDLSREKFLHERIRAKDIPLKDRVFIVSPESPQRYLTRTKTHVDHMRPHSHFTKQRAITVV